MHYVCIENKQVISILNYEPNVPDTVLVHQISDNEYKTIQGDTHFFNVETMKVESLPQEVFDQKEIEEQNRLHQRYLNSTDWMVLRHIRQKELGVETSLTDEEYKALEAKRQDIASQIV
jgi:hypothetical protein